MRILLLCISLIVLTLGVLGCEIPSSNTLKPQFTSNDGVRLETPVRLPDGSINWRKFQVLYISCGTNSVSVVLDYPSDFTGPIPDGHGRIGQTDPGYYCATYTVGDPTDTYDFLGDPDGPELGDGDGTDVKSRSIGDPDSPEAGDPTSDD